MTKVFGVTADVQNVLVDFLTDGAVPAVMNSDVGAAVSGLPGLVDGPGDAYRHLLLSAELARTKGEAQARTYLDSHESLPLGADEMMDLRNNEVGIAIGNYARQNGLSWAQTVALVQD